MAAAAFSAPLSRSTPNRRENPRSLVAEPYNLVATVHTAR